MSYDAAIPVLDVQVEKEMEESLGRYRKMLTDFADALNNNKKYRKYIYNTKTGDIFNARFQIRTRDELLHVYVIFDNGKVATGEGKIENPDVIINYRDKLTMSKIWFHGGVDALNNILANNISTFGNMSALARFFFMLGIVSEKKRAAPDYTIKEVDMEKDRDRVGQPAKFRTRLGRKIEAVQHLEDPYLADYDLNDFPRLKYLRNRRFGITPEVCIERAVDFTNYQRAKGFQKDKDGFWMISPLRMAECGRYILENKTPQVFDQHLIAGSTTAKEVGSVMYPEANGTLLWTELYSISNPDLQQPQNISDEDAEILATEIFPYWMDKTIRENCRLRYNNPYQLELDGYFVLYFMLKSNAISHTIPDFKTPMDRGLESMMAEAVMKEQEATDKETKDFYRAMYIAMEGILTYANHLSEEAARLAALLDENKPEEKQRKEELLEISKICKRVPAKPCETLWEAVNVIWILFVCVHQLDRDAAMSLGRVDQLLQPYFLKDMEKAKTPEEKEAMIKKAIELSGMFILKTNDHEPLRPGTLGSFLFNASSSDDTVTLGGVDRDGNSAVHDMTFIFLKAHEMLCIQDPNLHGRYHPEVNSKEYLKRLCEVNCNNVGLPIIQNDKTMIECLVHEGIPIEDARDWAASGCVEPDIIGKHFGHTNCMCTNSVAPLEMALNNGVHPLIGKQIGPQTGDVSTFKTFEDFVGAYKEQMKYIIEQSVIMNNYFGETHKMIHPSPLLSALFQGPMQKGKDVVWGGAVYNSSGVAMISISDVIDSLLVIKELVYDKKEVTFPRLKEAIDANFEGDENQKLLARIMQVQKFGSNSGGVPIAQDIMDFIYHHYITKDNYRGGKYWVGYWSISMHVGFGRLSGALPSGRLKGKPFTPGLTPSPHSQGGLLDNIYDVAALDHIKMTNNIAFNVKLVPDPNDTPEETINQFSSYVHSYMELGGMQWQGNVCTSDILREAQKNPEDYKWLIVRISGYNAYFTQCHPELQQELIERTEFAMR